jgi:putative hydrolase of the HAD superfamily
MTPDTGLFDAAGYGKRRAVNFPKGALIDLDDTILDDSGGIATSWAAVCRDAHALRPRLDEARLYEVISRHRTELWADAERHRVGRQNPAEANQKIVHAALRELSVDDRDLAAHLADRYVGYRELHRTIIPGALETIERFRSNGARLALITNGGAKGQRNKIQRFGLSEHFDGIFIEGELGFGKPDQRVYLLALNTIRTCPEDTWCIGDNLEWDVLTPKLLSVFGIWVNAAGGGLPAEAKVQPDRIVRSIAELP